jgi:hypothetical protein
VPTRRSCAAVASSMTTMSDALPSRIFIQAFEEVPHP